MIKNFHDESPFGDDKFGKYAENVARFFGTSKYIVGQTIVVILWVLLNIAGISLRWDPYPFIALNLVFSLQAAYAAPLILVAQTRQSERDKLQADADSAHREAIAQNHQTLLEQNTALTEQVAKLTEEIHNAINK